MKNGDDLVTLRLTLHVFELWLATAAVVSCLTWFVPGVPAISSRAVEFVAPRLVSVYSGIYGLGGVLTIVGLWRGSLRTEAAGLVLLAAGITVSSVGLLGAFGGHGIVSAALQFGAAIACLVRHRSIVKGAA